MSKVTATVATVTATATPAPAASISSVELDPQYGPMFTMRKSRKGVPANLDRYPFRFGPDKARLILAHIAELQQFVATYPVK